jgi:hypothetical protein
MADIYEARREPLEKYLKEFRPQPNQVGLACAIDGSTAGIELFENPAVFHQFFHKLVRVYAAEVVFESEIATMVPNTGALKDLLQRIADSKWDEYPAVGSRKELRTKTGRLNGSALDVDGQFFLIYMQRVKL